MRMTGRRFCLVLAAAIAVCPASRAQNDSGMVAFVNSGAKEAQSAFLHGLAQLHDFEYEGAVADFRRAEAIDPGFAMAYWGEAMTYNHPVWNEWDGEAARKVLERLGATPEERLAKAPTPREKDYLRAVEILLGQGQKKDRDQRYAEAMERISRSYPDDVDAAAFYALALLGTQEGVRDERVYMQAAAILMPLFYKYPQHPGVAHYLIHACDDPVHAPLALPAARTYSRIAPRAPHAQHMTSHIYLALGMWNEVVTANEAAVAEVRDALAKEGKTDQAGCGHYNYWLEYGYLETGRQEQARRVVEDCHARALRTTPDTLRNIADPDDAALLSFLQMQARYVVDTGDCDGDVATWNVDLGDAALALFYQAAERAFCAVSHGNVEAATKLLSRMDELMPQLPGVFDGAGLAVEDPMRHEPMIKRMQIESMTMAAQGRMDDAVATAAQAAAEEKGLPYAFGPPAPEKPSYELLGELLLKQNRAADAKAAFQSALLRAPNRTQTLADMQKAVPGATQHR
jgi:tetratricopeptide (TPR) repeat protein